MSNLFMVSISARLRDEMECPVESTADRKARLVSRADNNGLIITTKIQKYLLRQDQQVFIRAAHCSLVSVLIQVFYGHLKNW